MTKLSKFGEIVRVERVLKGESLSDLAKALGCSPSLLSAMETGEKIPTANIALGVGAHYRMNKEETLALVLAAMEDASSFRICFKDDLDKELVAQMTMLAACAPERVKRNAADYLRNEIGSLFNGDDDDTDYVQEEERKVA